MTLAKIIGFLLLPFVCHGKLSMSKDLQDVLGKEVLAVEALLPLSLIKEVPKLELKIKKLNAVEINLCLGQAKNGSKLARYSRLFNNIVLSKSLYKSFKLCPDKLRNMLRQNLAHEYFHAYDLESKNEVEIDWNCKGGREDRDHVCVRARKHQRRDGNISSSKVFANSVFLHGRSGDDVKGARTYRPYETFNKEEFAAVNFEAFIFEKNFKCRRPSVYGYFSTHFDHFPYQEIECPSSYKVFSMDSGGKPLKIDLKRVYQVHYLFAGEGDAAVSRWGHSMIRFVMCAPERKGLYGKTIPATPYGEECLNDLDYHVVASFRAQIFQDAIDPWKGIKGDYPSGLAFISLKDVIKRYTRDELRDLISYPLSLSETEKRNVVNKALELHWDYRGTYKFISNNCATEAFSLIAGSIEKGLGINLFSPLSPKGALKALEFNHLLDQDKPTQEFKSKRYFYDLIFERLSLNNFQINSIDEYKEMNFQKREKVINDFFEKNIGKTSSLETRKLLSSFLVLENFVFEKKRMEYLEIGNAELKAAAERGDFGADHALDLQELLPGGYGIPTSEEFQKVEEELRLRSESLEQIDFDSFDSHSLEAAKAEMVELASFIKKLRDEIKSHR